MEPATKKFWVQSSIGFQPVFEFGVWGSGFAPRIGKLSMSVLLVGRVARAVNTGWRQLRVSPLFGSDARLSVSVLDSLFRYWSAHWPTPNPEPPNLELRTPNLAKHAQSYRLVTWR